MSVTRIFQWTGSRGLVNGNPLISWTRSYAKPTTTSTTAGGTIAALGKSKTLKGGLKAGAKAAPVLEKKILSVETDVNKLVTHLCGSNLMKEGGEDVKLGSDEEYPDWLWNLRTGPPVAVEELEPGSEAYWRRIRQLALRRKSSLRHLRKYPRVGW